MIRSLRVLQANLHKSENVHHALHNDETLKDFTAILGQEPNCFMRKGRVVVPGTGRNWVCFTPPPQVENTWPVRSCIWVRADVAAVQLSVACSDITTVAVTIGQRRILMASVYIPPIHAVGVPPSQSQELMQVSLQSLHELIEKERRNNPGTELVIAGDFNRHDTLWGGPRVGETNRQGEAAPIIEFMDQHGLQSLLEPGVATFQKGRSETTIDLSLASPWLASNMLRCTVWQDNYGSDHETILTEFNVTEEAERPEARLLIKHAQWPKVREEVATTLLHDDLLYCHDVDELASRITGIAHEALKRHCPCAKPSPYAKRWWNADLTTLRQAYIAHRNAARSLRRATGEPDAEAERRATAAKHEFHHTIRRVRKQHWRDFLDEVTNVWKATQYLNPQSTSGFARIPVLENEDRTIQDKAEIADELIATFFPPPPEPEVRGTEEPMHRGEPFEPLQKEEIRRALFTSHPYKAAGLDGLPTVVWRELWPVLHAQIHHLFSLSLSTGKLPEAWKVAKIVRLRKGEGRDYTKAANYRPISLLSTLGKALELVVAERISYLVETQGRLPHNHFGGRKQRSAVQALLYLQEHIYNAWRGKMTLSLVSFDVKGAYNNVAKGPELQRLRERGIPEVLVRWIDDFCTERKACVVVNGFTSEVRLLPQAGLPQGSPLAPILFLFFNATLVQQAIRNGGSMAYIDDYTAWVSGPSAAENTRILQEEVLPKLEQWERESGAVFEASKTSFIHFTRNLRGGRDSDVPLSFKGQEIPPVARVKLLGVEMDKKLNYRAHVAAAASRAQEAALAVKRLKGLRPEATRQMVSAVVWPVADYASPMWYPRGSETLIKLLSNMQRTSVQAIICSFRTVALPIAEAEAGVKQLRQRLLDQCLQFWTGVHTLNNRHPLAVLCRAPTHRRFTSPMQEMARRFNLVNADRVATIDPVAVAPWTAPVKTVIKEREEALQEADRRTDGTLDVYADASIREGKVGVGVYVDANTQLCETVAQADAATVLMAELAAIWKAVHLVKRIWDPGTQARIFTDSKAALHAIAWPRRDQNQELAAAIGHAIGSSPISVHWIPGHDASLGNSKADELAKQATTEDRDIPAMSTARPLSVVRKAARKCGIRPSYDAFRATKSGQFTKKIDRAVPGKHTLLLYNGLKRSEAAILSQIRTGCARINKYLSKIGAAESELCKHCQQIESIPHLLFTCRKWEQHRADMRAEHGNRYGELSYALGGYNNVSRDGEQAKWKPDLKAVKATIKFVLATKRLDYVPGGGLQVSQTDDMEA